MESHHLCFGKPSRDIKRTWGSHKTTMNVELQLDKEADNEIRMGRSICDPGPIMVKVQEVEPEQPLSGQVSSRCHEGKSANLWCLWCIAFRSVVSIQWVVFCINGLMWVKQCHFYHAGNGNHTTYKNGEIGDGFPGFLPSCWRETLETCSLMSRLAILDHFEIS